MGKTLAERRREKTNSILDEYRENLSNRQVAALKHLGSHEGDFPETTKEICEVLGCKPATWYTWQNQIYFCDAYQRTIRFLRTQRTETIRANALEKQAKKGSLKAIELLEGQTAGNTIINHQITINANDNKYLVNIAKDLIAKEFGGDDAGDDAENADNYQEINCLNEC